MMRKFFLSAIAVLAAGCALIQAPVDEGREMAGMLADYRRLTGLMLEEQRSEFNAAQAAYELTPTDATRLKLALTMLLPHAPWRDDARVLALLSVIEHAPSASQSTRYDFAQMLLLLLAERLQGQREEQRKIDQLIHQLREERRKADEMQQKIESLRAIDRDTRMRRKKP